MVRSFTKLDNYFFVAGLFLLLAFAAYFSVLHGGFVLDDEHFIQKNEHVRTFDLKSIYTNSVTQGANKVSNFYRPNQQAAFALMYRFFKENPVPYHVLSVGIHCINAFLIYIFFSFIFFERNYSFMASLLFLVHPVQTEAVAFISGLSDPLGVFFLLLSLLFFYRFLQNAGGTGSDNVLLSEKPDTGRPGVWEPHNRRRFINWSYVFYIFFALQAILCKESMVMVLPLSALVLLRERKNKQWKSLIPVVVIVSVYTVLKFVYFSQTGTLGLTTQTNLYTEHLWVRLCTFVNIVPEYLRLFFYPAQLNYEKPYVAYVTLFSFRAFIGTAVVILFLSGVLSYRKHPVPALLCAWVLFTMSPFTGIIALNSMYLEHWLYLSMPALCMLAVYIVFSLFEKKKHKYLYICFSLLMFWAVFLTSARAAQWADTEKFYLNEMKYAEDSVRVCNNLGMFYAEHNDLDLAQKYYIKAIAEGLASPEPYYNLSSIYLAQGRVKEAAALLEKSLEIKPDFYYSMQRLKKLRNMEKNM